jgi:hypothetical protein
MAGRVAAARFKKHWVQPKKEGKKAATARGASRGGRPGDADRPPRGRNGHYTDVPSRSISANTSFAERNAALAAGTPQ